MHPNAQLIEKFYTSFQALDADGMSSCYHPEVVFSETVFGQLEGARASAMWHMLCGRAKTLQVTFTAVKADDRTGSAHWEARYNFGKSARPVHNVIEAAFVFRDGLIIRHADTFDLWRWSGMALGPAGTLFGWSPPMQAAIRRDARRGLDAYVGKQAGRS